jgi:imidazolonepropionase-like amidohydrolase
LAGNHYFRLLLLNIMKRILILYSFLLISGSRGFAQETFPVNGVHDKKHLFYVFTNARIVQDYKTVIEKGTLIIKDGKVDAVGAGIPVPRGSLVFDLSGKTIYPSLIEIYSDYGMPEIKRSSAPQYPQMLTNTKGAYDWNQAVKPEVAAHLLFSSDVKKAEELKKLGFGSAHSFVKDGIVRGTSVVVLLSEEREHKAIVKDRAAQMLSFDKGSSTQDYPSSLMGSIALLRQTHLDGQWYRNNKGRNEFNISLDAWNTNLELPQIAEVSDRHTALRADRVGDEFAQQYIIKGGGDEYQRISDIKGTNARFIVGLNFPQPYDVEDPYDALQITLADLKHWEMAPLNPSALEKAGVTFALTGADLKDRKDFWKNLRKAIEYGLSEEQALKALTHTPAEILGVSDKLGALKPGMIANFLITSGNLFDKRTILYENWVRGVQFKINDLELSDLRGKYQLRIGDMPPYNITVEGEPSDPKVTSQDTSLKIRLTRTGNLVTLILEQKTPPKGAIRLNGYIIKDNLRGNGQLEEGDWVTWEASLISRSEVVNKPDTAKPQPVSYGPLLFPNKEYGWQELPRAKDVLIKNVTVWTNEKEGILKRASVLVKEGKIASVSAERDTAREAAPSGIEVIDGEGKHLTPGIIDEHSHIAISRGVNEGTQAVTSEVRIGDVVDPDDIDIYRQLSGGVTTSQLLHGSANPIGGQSAIIKLRWGAGSEEMKFKGAPGFIKFALGENVKQSNWGDRNVVRFPQTRMGVEQVFMDAFTRAKEYQAQWERYNQDQQGLQPRKDLELEALVEILKKKRFITCHSYVQSEINMLMHLADSMGFKVNTFTHILEGYKVADKMKSHGVAASTFADWWAYKYEVIEAIPHNAAIMTKMGITTSVNSDDAEMGRRLNQEAAKAVKYGGLSEEEAFKLCSLNPAKMLRLDDKTGSIREGKDADLVLWTDHPLSIYSKVEKTFVDGICYYDAKRDLTLREEIKKERARIMQKMVEAKKAGESTQKPVKNNKEHFHCEQ